MTVFQKTSRAKLVTNLYSLISKEKISLAEIFWEQHLFHEKRKWSAPESINSINFAILSEKDRSHIFNAGRAELTTKPGADRLARLADKECRRWQDLGDTYLSTLCQACGTWARYWNEEEAFHEMTLIKLSEILGLNPIKDATIIEFRKIFPDDDMLRTLFLLAISEITASVNYSYCANVSKDLGLKNLFKQIAYDETQHMTYFLSFAKALIDSGKYPVKNVFAVAYIFLREGGEVYGSSREKLENRSSHVNWWDTIEYNLDTIPENIERKKRRIFLAIKQVTGIEVNSLVDLEKKWLEMVGC